MANDTEVLDPAATTADTKVESSAPAKSEARSLNDGASKKDEFLETVNKASTPAQLRAAAEQLRRMGQKPANEKVPADPDADDGSNPKKEPVKQETATEEASADETSKEDKTEDATEEATEAKAETGEEETESTEDEDSPITPISSKNAKVSLPEGDQVGRLAISFKKRNKDWTMDQAMEAARTQLGVKTKDSADEPAKVKSPSDLPDTVEGVDTAIEALETQKVKAAEDLNLAEIAKIDSQLRKLDRQRTSLERQGEQQERQQVAEYDTAFASSEAKAADLYEFASKPDSPGGKRMLEIEESLLETEDPRYYAPNKPLLIAQMVAAELNIAPKSKKAAPAKPAVAAPPAASKKQVIPAGGAKTTPPADPAQNADVARVSKISNMAELRAEFKRRGFSQ